LPVTVRGALLSDLAGQARVVLRLRGPDASRFVQGIVTADVAGARPGFAIAGALLTVKAKLVTDLVVLPQGEGTLDLLVPAGVGDEIAALLDRHVIMDQVEIERRDDIAVGVTWADDEEEAPTIHDVLSTWIARHPVPGRLVVGTPANVAAALREVERADDEAFTAHRIDTATPAWGFELQAGFFPPEVGLVYAVSYSKGCFMGQEPLARIHARGQVNRVMVRVATEARSVPAELAQGERVGAGTLTSIARGRGLAIVRRSFAEEGTTMITADGVDVRVISGPLGDDPGVAGR
jgi:folate-binding protein YgfZ